MNAIEIVRCSSVIRLSEHEVGISALICLHTVSLEVFLGVDATGPHALAPSTSFPYGLQRTSLLLLALLAVASLLHHEGVAGDGGEDHAGRVAVGVVARLLNVEKKIVEDYVKKRFSKIKYFNC